MKYSGLLALGLSVALGFASSGAVLAQSASGELTADEIKLLFNKQKELGLGNQKTRGLVLAPSSGQAAAEGANSATPTATSATYVELEKDQQVNIQISFDFDSASLRSDQKPKLTALCEAMKSVDVPVFRIVGHTDASGTAAYNERLSLLRAKEVKRFVVNDCGIPETRLEAVGVGERFLLNGDDPRADENRRVEFQALS